MSDAIRLAHARLMCRGPFTAEVSVDGSSTAPDGKTRRGLLRVPERVVDTGTGQVLESQATLRIPAADVLTVDRGSLITIAGTVYEVREKLPVSDGVTVTLAITPDPD